MFCKVLPLSVLLLTRYLQNVEQEAVYEIPERKPPPSWPSEGRVEMNDVKMAYRPGLPLVLKGITMSSNASEKIGVVGRRVSRAPLPLYYLRPGRRTGAGKSSIMLWSVLLCDAFVVR